MLGSPDPEQRDGIAYPALATWVDARGLRRPAGRARRRDGRRARRRARRGGTDSVFRRSFSVLVLAECIDRDNDEHLLPPGQGPRVGRPGRRAGTSASATLRGYVPGKGWAHAVAHGADAIGVAGALAPPRGPRADRPARRDRRPAAGAGRPACSTAGEPDRMALATMQVLRRNVARPQGARALGRPDRRRRPHLGGTGDRDPYLDTRQRRRRSCARSTSSSPGAPTRRGPLRPAAGAGRRAPQATNPGYLEAPAAVNSACAHERLRPHATERPTASGDELTGHGGRAGRRGRPAPTAWRRCSPCPGPTSSRCTTARSRPSRRCGCSTCGTSRPRRSRPRPPAS